MKRFILFLLIASVTCLQAKAQDTDDVTEDDLENFSTYLEKVKPSAGLDQAIESRPNTSWHPLANSESQYLDDIKQMTSEPAYQAQLNASRDDYNSYTQREQQTCKNKGIKKFECRYGFIKYLHQKYGIAYP